MNIGSPVAQIIYHYIGPLSHTCQEVTEIWKKGKYQPFHIQQTHVGIFWGGTISLQLIMYIYIHNHPEVDHIY